MGLTDQWIECFRSGSYGDKGNFSAADLDAMAATYNPALHEAPAVIGHPHDNAPAVGWVEAVKCSGDKLLVKLRRVAPAFEDLVRRGLFKKRSISIYPSFSATGKPYLRHVGFLGAMPPEVKGLADLSFSSARPFVEIDFAEGTAGAPTLRGFNASPGIAVDAASVRRLERANRYAADHAVSFGEALSAVWSAESE